MSEQINTKYKDRLFCLIFGKENYKENLLSLYNAVNNTDYTECTEIEINTIDDVIYMKMKNDVSCIFSSIMSIFEQQSTLNPNMPFREFEYSAKLYDKYVTVHKKDIYGTSLVKLPAPQCIVFYNGTNECADKSILRLSDAFEVPVEGYEWTSIMYNINLPHNKDLLEKCKALKEYSELVSLIREYQKNDNIEIAVDRAVKQMIDNKGVLSQLLLAHRAEVCDMCITEYNEKIHEDNVRAEGIEIGKSEGIEIGKAEEHTKLSLIMIQSLMQNSNVDAKTAMNMLNIPKEEQDLYIEQLK